MGSSKNFFDELIKSNVTNLDSESNFTKECYKRFQKDTDVMNFSNFCSLLKELFTDFENNDRISENHFREMFKLFDVNSDDKIDFSEFQKIWCKLIVPTLKPKCALIIIDVQNDFIDGSLAIRNCPAGHDGLHVVPVINKMLKSITFDAVIYTYDWHPADHISFIDNVNLRKFHVSSSVPKNEDAKVFDTVVFDGNPPTEQKLWPKHCVQKSWGSELHRDLSVADGAIFIYKGSSSDIDSYSAFWDNQKRSQTNLSKELKSRNINLAFVCGLAYDYCVGFTALHALEDGFRTILVEDACRGVALDDIQKMKKNLIRQHGAIISSEEVLDIIKAKKRPLALGYFTVMLNVRG